MPNHHSIIKSSFPLLESDQDFKITSDIDHCYNCIAWSIIKNDTYVWPIETPLDGCYWPEDLSTELTIDNFKALYAKYGYEECDSHSLEKEFQKIAIYAKDDVVTHGARQLTNGKWTSKLGPQHDIQHSDPFTLSSEGYGEPVCFMKRRNESFGLNSQSMKRKLSKKQRRNLGKKK